MASSVPFVSVKSSVSTLKKAASSCFTASYSGYTARLDSLKRSRRYSITLGDAPTVFSLKSRRNLSPRPPVGGLYGAIFRTASRGCNTPGGRSILLLAKPDLHGARMRFQALGAGERGDGRRKHPQSCGSELLHRDNLDKVGRRKATANARGSGCRQNMIRTGSVVARSLRTAWPHEDATRVLNSR